MKAVRMTLLAMAASLTLGHALAEEAAPVTEILVVTAKRSHAVDPDARLAAMAAAARVDFRTLELVPPELAEPESAPPENARAASRIELAAAAGDTDS